MTDVELSCPTPLRHDTIQLAHGGGGRLMRDLLEQIFLPAFDNAELRKRHDSAVVSTTASRLAFTSDGYVVHPRFFPGGDIGKLAVIGTVNDLAMAGATPRWLSASFILEEGLAVEELQRIVLSMRDTAYQCGVDIVTGDTKVVDRGNGDGIYITTAGVGEVAAGVDLGPTQMQVGDVVLVSGDVGRHGAAVMSTREGLGFSGDVASDCEPLHQVVGELLDDGVAIHCLRDLTRGGMASALNELARDGNVDIHIDESAVPVSDGVRGACELLGLDPLYVACEGRMAVIVSASSASHAEAKLRSHHPSACRIGRVNSCPSTRASRVTCRAPFGNTRVLDLLSGQQLPRIC